MFASRGFFTSPHRRAAFSANGRASGGLVACQDCRHYPLIVSVVLDHFPDQIEQLVVWFSELDLNVEEDELLAQGYNLRARLVEDLSIARSQRVGAVLIK